MKTLLCLPALLLAFALSASAKEVHRKYQIQCVPQGDAVDPKVRSLDLTLHRTELTGLRFSIYEVAVSLNGQALFEMKETVLAATPIMDHEKGEIRYFQEIFDAPRKDGAFTPMLVVRRVPGAKSNEGLLFLSQDEVDGKKPHALTCSGDFSFKT